MTRQMHRRGTGYQPVALLALALLPAGCQTPQNQAREQATQRWNLVRAQVKAQLAADLLAGGHIEDAAAEVHQARELDPGDAELQLLEARVRLAQGENPRAERLLLALAAGAPAEHAASPQVQAEAAYLLGVIAQQRQQWDAALEHYARASETRPDEITYLVALVQVLLQRDCAREALELLAAREQSLGHLPAFHAAVAECRELLGEWPAAAAAWRNIADGADDPGIRVRLAAALARAGQPREAVAILHRILERSADLRPTPEAASQQDPQGFPGATSVRLLLAGCLAACAQDEDAALHARAVLREEPRNVTALYLLALLAARQGRFDHGLRLAEQALLVEPDRANLLELAAALALRTGQLERAERLAQRVEELSPGGESVLAREIRAVLVLYKRDSKP